MSDDNTQGGAEPSPASDGYHNTHMATARLSAAEEIRRLRLTDAERTAITEASDFYIGTRTGVTLRGLLDRTLAAVESDCADK